MPEGFETRRTAPRRLALPVHAHQRVIIRLGFAEHQREHLMQGMAAIERADLRLLYRDRAVEGAGVAPRLVFVR